MRIIIYLDITKTRKRILELGCGDGSFLLALSKRYQSAYLKGVDVDSKLIESAAIKTRTGSESLKPNPSPSLEISSIPLCFRRRGKQLPLTMSRVMTPEGSLCNFECTETDAAPQPNVLPIFEIENIIQNPTSYREQQFDTLVCLSVIKWVHLNWGDKGLTRLFFKFYNSLKVGGHLILDVHNWKSYKKKQHASQAIGYNFCSLQVKPGGIVSRLEKLGFALKKVIEHGFETGIKRPIYILEKEY